MKFNRLLLLLAIVVPVVACIICLRTLNEINKKSDEVLNSTKVVVNTPVTNDTSKDNDIQSEQNNSVESQMAGESYTSSIGEPLSKIYTDASVAISVANIYKEADETTEIVGTTAKYDKLTAQKYPKGWSRVTTGSIAGWMRTENITFPEGTVVLSNNSVVGREGTVNAEPHLNMRAKASATSEKVTTIPDKTKLTILEVSNGWYKVSYASSTGWVSAEYIDL